MSLTKNLLTRLTWALALAIVGLYATGLKLIIVLSVALVSVLFIGGIARLVRGETIPGMLLANLGLFIAGAGFAAYGMWTTLTLGTTGGFGSYDWIIAQVNVLVGLFSVGMSVTFATLPRGTL